MLVSCRGNCGFIGNLKDPLVWEQPARDYVGGVQVVQVVLVLLLAVFKLVVLAGGALVVVGLKVAVRVVGLRVVDVLDEISCGDAPPWRVRPGRRAVGRNSQSPQVGPGTPC